MCSQFPSYSTQRQLYNNGEDDKPECLNACSQIDQQSLPDFDQNDDLVSMDPRLSKQQS